MIIKKLTSSEFGMSWLVKPETLGSSESSSGLAMAIISTNKASRYELYSQKPDTTIYHYNIHKKVPPYSLEKQNLKSY